MQAASPSAEFYAIDEADLFELVTGELGVTSVAVLERHRYRCPDLFELEIKLT